MAAVAIPKQHKAIIFDKPGEVSTKIEMIDTPEPGQGEVLINLSAAPRTLVPPSLPFTY